MMHAGHAAEAHGHAHIHTRLIDNKIKFALILTALVFVVELAGGYFSNSLALMSDAGHVFTDLLALLLSWFGIRQAERMPTHRMTFGFHRVGVLVALANSLTLVGISILIFYEAFHRLRSPEAVESQLMFVIAVLGFAANALILFMLREEQKGNINVRSAFLHVAGDALASVGVVVGGIAIYFTNWFWLDPILSIAIAIIIAVGSWEIIKEGLAVFLEATPAHVDLDEMLAELKQVKGVQDIHDLHVWSIAPHLHALSCHVLVDDQHVSEGSLILQELSRFLSDMYGITHTTVQLECVNCDPNNLFCTFRPTHPSGHPNEH